VDDQSQKEAKTRISRIAGQVAGIQRMIDDDRYCVDILNQIAAARSALDALGIKLLSGHLESCILGHGTETAHEAAAPMSRDQLLEELRAALSNFLK
jgi:DNA-binding FrmR family transcriptional regulator